MDATATSKTYHAFTLVDRVLGDGRDSHLLPAGSEIAVILASELSTPDKLVWEMRAVEITRLTIECVHHIARHRILFADADLRFDAGDFFDGETPYLGSIDAVLKTCVSKPSATFC